MKHNADWQIQNNDYLAAALKWLRLLLEYRSNQGPQVVERPISEPARFAEEPQNRSGMLGLFKRRPDAREPSPPTVPLLPPAKITWEHVEQAAAELNAAAAKMDPPPALHALSAQFGLSRFEEHLLLLCSAVEMDTRIASLCARAQNDAMRPYPTFALALNLFDEPSWDVRSPMRALRYFSLIEINQPGSQPLLTSPLRADERVVDYLKDLHYLDDRLASLLMPLRIAEPQAELPPSQQAAVDTILRRWMARPDQPLPIIQLLGPDSSSKRIIAWQAARSLNRSLYHLPAEMIPTQAAELETLARFWFRESLLAPVALYLEVQDAGEGAETLSKLPLLKQLLNRSDGFFFIDTRDVMPGFHKPTLTLDISKPTPLEQQSAWAAALGDAASGAPASLASQFNLNLATIQQIAKTALEETGENGDDQKPLIESLWQACLVSARPQMDLLAQRIIAKATWQDIVVPEHELNLLKQIAHQVGHRSTVYEDWGFRNKMNRGLGINALFAGDSGTGKTMAAEVIANDLQLNLYRIDLSAVVSKYIGQTEKNLRRLFDAAEDGGAILFFDEADAIFGKRSEVKDSHDRYANIEINYLLQRMEAYSGLAILATNMKSALDTAFMRRLRFIVNFPFPGPEQRKEIWLKVFPPETPTSNLDFDRLKAHDLTGGSIHNIALNAAFMAAQAGSAVTMRLLGDAARAELRKMGRPINEADFRFYDTE
jgi:ATPase family protein associated with various cellular activities (AAA)/winged helix domain-containing protein